MTEFEKKCVDVLDAMDGQQPLVSCQGQGMDGYSALANFTELTRKLKAAQKKEEAPETIDNNDSQPLPLCECGRPLLNKIVCSDRNCQHTSW